jgi:hypothetical protein
MVNPSTGHSRARTLSSSSTAHQSTRTWPTTPGRRPGAHRTTDRSPPRRRTHHRPPSLVSETHRDSAGRHRSGTTLERRTGTRADRHHHRPAPVTRPAARHPVLVVPPQVAALARATLRGLSQPAMAAPLPGRHPTQDHRPRHGRQPTPDHQPRPGRHQTGVRPPMPPPHEWPRISSPRPRRTSRTGPRAHLPPDRPEAARLAVLLPPHTAVLQRPVNQRRPDPHPRPVPRRTRGRKLGAAKPRGSGAPLRARMCWSSWWSDSWWSTSWTSMWTSSSAASSWTSWTSMWSSWTSMWSSSAGSHSP